MRQIFNILWIFISADLSRRRDLVLITIGFAISTFTVSVLLAIPAGLDRAVGATGLEDVAIVLSGNASAESDSDLAPFVPDLVGDLPEVARDPVDRPMLAPQFVANTKLMRADGVRNTVQVRGITPAIWPVIDAAAASVSGSLPQQGRRQLLFGSIAARQYAALSAEKELRLRKQSWRISGTLHSHGNLWESELWADLSALQAEYNSDNRLSVIWVKLRTPEDFPAFVASLRADPRLRGLQAHRQSEYYRQRLGLLSSAAHWLAAGVALLLGIGAALAIASALSMVLMHRRREIATLRALGFRAFNVVVAVFLEVALVGLLTSGTVILAVYVVFDGFGFSTSSGNHAIYAKLSFPADVIATAFLYTFVLGLLSTTFPACRVAYGSLMNGLRSE